MGQRKYQKGNKIYLETYESGSTTYRNLMGFSKNNSKREDISDKCIYQENKKISNKQPNFIPQGTRKRIKQA